YRRFLAAAAHQGVGRQLFGAANDLGLHTPTQETATPPSRLEVFVCFSCVSFCVVTRNLKFNYTVQPQPVTTDIFRQRLNVQRSNLPLRIALVIELDFVRILNSPPLVFHGLLLAVLLDGLRD